jgi:hypothetical protein
MVADGLTKNLYAEQHCKFVQQLGLVDISDRITERKLRELTLEDLERYEEALEGGESPVDAEYWR